MTDAQTAHFATVGTSSFKSDFIFPCLWITNCTSHFLSTGCEYFGAEHNPNSIVVPTEILPSYSIPNDRLSCGWIGSCKPVRHQYSLSICSFIATTVLPLHTTRTIIWFNFLQNLLNGCLFGW